VKCCSCAAEVTKKTLWGRIRTRSQVNSFMPDQFGLWLSVRFQSEPVIVFQYTGVSLSCLQWIASL